MTSFLKGQNKYGKMLRFANLEYRGIHLLVSVFIGILKIITFSQEARREKIIAISQILNIIIYK